MIRKCSKLLIIFIFSLTLTSCWDYEDIDKKSIAISIGVDQVADKVQFSSEITKLIPSQGDTEKAQTANVYNTVSYGKNFEDARIHYDAINPFPVFLGVTRVVIFGTDYAKKGIESYFNRIGSIYDYRKTLLPVVSREKPTELFDIKVEKDISVGFLIENTINSLANSGKTLYPNVGEVLSNIALDEVGYVMPYVGIEHGHIVYLGFAVMKDSKLVGVIDLVDTDGVLYLLAEKPILVEAIPDPKKEENVYSFRTAIKKRKIKTNYMNKKVVINIDLDLNAALRYQYYTQPVSDKKIKKLEEMISEKVKEDMRNIIKRSQKEFQCDIFQFAKYFRAQYPNIYKKIKWEDAFKDANVNVTVKTKIINKNLADPNAKKKY
ncbi:Ger(x)C family spore germination protein [Marinisporobacter balticus]|uniref:Ger(X)C family germination protein n=1 Tax=Marinisporobacter balticus TaxID=2018667 RepID=A0A4R2L4B8_9FIRM|nr:Ger(x)C family spore germination protein [Marinisporobacter balticus]TCO77448.1 Ger(x)C family germination protein [Marinisporobacter balticus]